MGFDAFVKGLGNFGGTIKDKWEGFVERQGGYTQLAKNASGGIIGLATGINPIDFFLHPLDTLGKIFDFGGPLLWLGIGAVAIVGIIILRR